jgi:hypothetical protein
MQSSNVIGSNKFRAAVRTKRRGRLSKWVITLHDSARPHSAKTISDARD